MLTKIIAKYTQILMVWGPQTTSQIASHLKQGDSETEQDLQFLQDFLEAVSSEQSQAEKIWTVNDVGALFNNLSSPLNPREWRWLIDTVELHKREAA